MTDLETLNSYGELIEPNSIKLQRLLPGSIERVWGYLTESDLRRQWLASGSMEMSQGSSFEFVWRNGELTDPPGQAPDGSSAENRMTCEITELDPPRKISFTWGNTDGVTFELESKGTDVLLTVTHLRLPNRDLMLSVSAGWHAHLDLLVSCLTGRDKKPFWDEWQKLRGDYDKQVPTDRT